MGRKPPFSVSRILCWADSHHKRFGDWPRSKSGPIADAPWETWNSVDMALSKGLRGMPGGSTLPRFLLKHRGKRVLTRPPPLTIARILRWADAHCRRTGKYPKQYSGPVKDATGETWSGINAALLHGMRGLPAGLSLPRLLARERDTRNYHGMPKFTEAQIVRWAKAHQRRTGQWPHRGCGAVREAPSELWHKIDTVLRSGHRGLPGSSSLYRLRRKHDGGTKGRLK
jgi:hypothetical protein